MADMNDQPPEQTPPTPPEESFVPTEEDNDRDTPRREASAEFIVESEVGSQAALREAMDPANQSLGDALRLSFRVLQVVIVILIGLFLVSGFETVTEGQSGVMLRFGRIVKTDLDGAEFNMLPYPAGEFVLFEMDGRSVATTREFMPLLPQGQTLEDATELANVATTLRPDTSGYVLLNNGDIAHFDGSMSYRISDAKKYVLAVQDDQADQIVLLALQHAVVHIGAEMSLQQWTGMTEVDHERLIAKAQEVLNELNCGIRLKSLNVDENIPALAIRKIANQLQSQRDTSQRLIEQGREQAELSLIEVAGEQYAEVLALIDRYEAALADSDDEAAQRELEAVNEMLKSGVITGEVKNIVEPALAHRSTIVETLQRELATFESIYERYQENPELVSRLLWLEAYAEVLERPGLEVMYVPRNQKEVVMRLASSEQIRQLRRALRLEAGRAAKQEALYGRDRGWATVDESKRMLDTDEEGTLRGKGSGN